MWKCGSLSKSVLLRSARKFSSRYSYSKIGSGLLLGSVLLVNEVSEEKNKPWVVEYPAAAKKNDVLLSRRIKSDMDNTGLSLRLYQYQSCPYCCKVRAFLDYYGFSYDVVEVNPLTKSQTKFAGGYKKVPVLQSSASDKPLIESSLIISVLKTYLHRKQDSLDDILAMYPEHKTVDPKSNKQIVSHPNKYFIMPEGSLNSSDELQNVREERELREWVDNWFIHLISPNVYRTWSEALETFHYFSKVGEWERNFNTMERYLAIYVGAAFMWQISKMLKKRHKIDDERKAMADAFDHFLSMKGSHRTFLGGDLPNLGDLALYGAINSFEGCTAFQEMRKETEIGKWFDDVHRAVEKKLGRSLIEKKCISSQ
uniref:Prostaglandin E synthase 2 n=1 Tax=Ditylenchus dipsaci TaxID=166011 RepID=A0A915DBE2_9BILA